MDALKGGLDIIKKSVPKLVISIYHKSYDLFEIMEFIGYKTFLLVSVRIYPFVKKFFNIMTFLQKGIFL